MSVEQTCNLEPLICKDWIMKNKEKKMEQMSEGSSDESEEEPPPPVAIRRKVSFADAFGLNLVSVKEYDNQDSSEVRVGEEYYISCLFTINQDMEVRLQQQKLELERIELLHGSTTIRGIVRVLNLSFHKAVYVRVTLDGWQSHFDRLAEYVPGSSDGETDCFSFHLTLTHPFPVEGVRVEFCLRYESAVGTFWANNGGTNYIVFCYQRRRCNLKGKENEKESEKEKLEESNHKGIRSCLKAISKSYTEVGPSEASVEISEQLTPKVGRTRNKTEEKEGNVSCKILKDCCKTLVDRRRKRQAARLAHVQNYFAQKAMETQMGCNTYTDESATSIPRLSIQSRTDSQQGYGMDTPPMYHQIPLLSLDWGSTSTKPPLGNPPQADSEASRQVEDHCSDAASTHSDMKDQASASSESLNQPEVVASRDKVVVPMDDRGAEKDYNQGSADRRAIEIIKSDPTEPSKDLSSDQVVDSQLVKVARVACPALGSEPDRLEKELEASPDCQAPHHEHTSGFLSQDTSKVSPGDETRTAHDTETQNSEAGDGISPEECTGSSDTSKVKENTHGAVKDILTFTGIRDVPLTNRQAEGSSSKRTDINIDDSEEQVEKRPFYTELHEEDTESSRKGQDETTRDHSTEVQSVSSCESETFNENELCTLNKNLNKDNSELQKSEERRFEANEGLDIKGSLNETTIQAAKGGGEDETCPETKRDLDGATHVCPTGSTDPSKHIPRTTSTKEREVTSQEEDFELGKTLSSSNNRLLSWWQEFNSLGHTAKAFVYAILFVILAMAYLYDMPTCLALYLFSLGWWCSQGMKQRLDGASVDVD